MIRHITILFLVTTAITFSQNLDSLRIISTSIDSLNANSDSLTIKDSLTVVKKDSLAPIYSRALSEKSFIISRDDLLKTEYKYSGDFLRLFSFNFVKDLGFTGQPDEIFSYGLGNSGISFLQDGVLYNNRYDNYFNLNLIQSEDLDSIEVLPLPRGFLYGAYNNPISINFITRDFITRKPYSRIRYYQGPDRESMIDGSFNLHISNKLIASFDITNRIIDSTYRNTEFSIWQGKIKLRYLLSNQINIIATYNYNDYEIGYSGGINRDSIINAGGDPDYVLYDYISAPVIYNNGELTTLTHLPKLTFLLKPAEWIKTNASLYFLYTENNKRTFNKEYIENKVYGLDIRNNLNYEFFNFDLNFNYEKTKQYRNLVSKLTPADTVFTNSIYNSDYNVLSVAGILSANLLNSKLIPSVFYKLSTVNNNTDKYGAGSNNDNTSSGAGFDITYKVSDDINLYFGYSFLEKYFSSDSPIMLLETGVKYISEILKIDLKYFINNYNYLLNTDVITGNSIEFGDVSGIGLNLKFHTWKILLESNLSYYKPHNNSLNGVPEFQTRTGIYYKDVLFNHNLDLKTGFVFYHTGINNVYTLENGIVRVPTSDKVDFTLAGEIQKSAILYFLWQNLFDNNYYITPYYPMPARTIRFGVAWELFN